MQPLTPQQRINTPGYAQNLKKLKAFYFLFVFSFFVGLLVSQFLSVSSSLADSGVYKAIEFLIPSVSIIASRSSEPKLAVAVYGSQWLLAPCYLVLLFTMAPWSSATRAAVRYTTRIRQFSTGNKVFFILSMVFLIVYYLGDFRIIPFPTLLNGGLAPDNDPNWWLAEIYYSHLALATYGAIVVAGECFFFWALLLCISNCDIYILGRNLD